MSTDTLAAPAATTDTFPINGTDYVEFYVGNAKQAATITARHSDSSWSRIAGPETGVRDRVSYLLVQDKIRLVLTSAVRPDHPVAERVRLHGDGVHDIALWVDDAREAFAAAIGARRRAGARAARAAATTTARSSSPRSKSTATRSTHSSSVRTTAARSCPAFRRARPATGASPVGLMYVDHCVANVELGRDERLGRVLRAGHGLQEPGRVRRRGHLDGVLVAHVEGDVERQRANQVPDQRAGQGKAESRRSTNTWSSIGARACSTSPSRPTTSSAPCPRCATAVSSSSRRPRPTTPTCRARRQDRRADRSARGAWHPRRSRSRRVPASDLLEARAGPSRRCSTRSSSERAALRRAALRAIEANFKACCSRRILTRRAETQRRRDNTF